jgi:hypothetical protein
VTRFTFMGYVGDPDFHDGHIERVQAQNGLLQVIVVGSSGKRYMIEFRGVTRVESKRAEGMMLYALVYGHDENGDNMYIVVNWPEDDDAELMLWAKEFSFQVLE